MRIKRKKQLRNRSLKKKSRRDAILFPNVARQQWLVQDEDSSLFQKQYQTDEWYFPKKLVRSLCDVTVSEVFL